MKKLILSISIVAFIGCGPCDMTNVERPKQGISIVKVGTHDYVQWYKTGYPVELEHYAGCSNPAHK